jgi:hypothetical protein
MYELDRHSSFTDRRSDSLHGPGAHISRGEDTRTAGFQQEWRPRNFEFLMAGQDSLCDLSPVFLKDALYWGTLFHTGAKTNANQLAIGDAEKLAGTSRSPVASRKIMLRTQWLAP